MDSSSMCNKLTFRKLSCLLDGESFHAISIAFGKENAERMRTAFLRPTSDVLSTVPCNSYSWELCGNCRHRNTLYLEDKHCFLAYCPRRNAPDENLPEDALHVFQPNLPALLQKIADALKIRPGVMEGPIDGVWRIGEFSPSASRKHPVFLLTHSRIQAIQDTVCQLLLEYSTGPLVIFCMSDALPDSGTMRALQNRRSLFINIDSCLNISFDGEVTLKVESRSIFSPLAGKTDAYVDPSFGYDFPSGTSWENLLIHFQNDPEMVAFQIENTTSMHTRAEMKIGKSQWTMLRSFAEKFGRLPSSEILQNDALKKQRERLNKCLKAYFRTSEDAITLSDDQTEYVCRFKVKPSWHSTIHHVKKRT